LLTDEMKTSLQAAYDRNAGMREAGYMQQWKVEERERLLAVYTGEQKRLLLEIGAGTGRDSLYFAENRLEVTCVDLSEAMVKLCREKGLNARQMDFHHLDFPDASFQAVYAMNCLLHVPKAEIGQVLLEVRRVLESGGLFFYGVYGGRDSEGVWDDDMYEPKRFFSSYSDDALVSKASELFDVEDFHIVDQGDGNPHFQALLLRKSR
jgi:ubiquinone/menaquinone biosynthesis C-methylase UbiE